MVRAIGFEPSGSAGQSRRPSRYEPRFSAACPEPTDPYMAWLSRREIDRAREQGTQNRWVCRGPLLSAHMGARAVSTDR
jgi:hypothetical protein